MGPARGFHSNSSEQLEGTKPEPERAHGKNSKLQKVHLSVEKEYKAKLNAQNT